MANKGGLSRERIVEAAMDMIDEGGESAFSMRKLAARLGVDPMAIYHYHKSRRALLHDVLERFLAACDLPEPGADWRDDLRALCAAIRALARAHPGVFRLYELYEDWVRAEHRIAEAFHAVLMRAGFGEDETVRAARLLITYTEAFAVDEVSGWLAPMSEKEGAALRRSLGDDEHPVTRRLLPQMTRIDPDADFAFGLGIIIRGLEGGLRDQAG